MPLSNKDLDRIGLMMGQQLSESLEKINELVRRHDQTLYGVNGDNGLNSDVKTVKTDIQTLKDEQLITKTKIKTHAAWVSGTITVIGFAGREILKSVFGK